jgi:hypothetical protein
MHDPAAEPFAARVPEHERFKSFHIVDPMRGGLSKGAACVEVGRRLVPKLRWFWGLPGLTALTNALYWALVQVKPLTGRLVADADGPWELP